MQVNVSSKGVVTAKKAGKVTITATAKDGSKKKGTIKITIKEKTYSVTVSTDGNGLAAANPASGKTGTKVTLLAVPDDGYEFVEWEVLKGDVEIIDNTFTIGTSDVKVKAIFEEEEEYEDEDDEDDEDYDDEDDEDDEDYEDEDEDEDDPTPPASGKKYYALIVGNYDYVGTQNDLIGPRWDAAAMAGMLKGLSQGWKVTLKTNLSAEGMKSAISTAFSGATSNDVCLFYYSGHGVVASSSSADDDYQGALVGYDETLLLGSQLAYALTNATPGHVIVLLDSCGSGGMLAYRKGADGKMEATDQPATAKQFVNGINNAFKYFDMQARNKAAQEKISELRNGKFHVFTACAYRQVSTELFNSSTGYGFGIFTMCFLEGVGYDHENQTWYYSYSPADTNYGNSDGQVAYTEIGDWTYLYVDYIKQSYPQFGIEQDLCGYSEDSSFVFFIR